MHGFELSCVDRLADTNELPNSPDLKGSSQKQGYLLLVRQPTCSRNQRGPALCQQESCCCFQPLLWYLCVCHCVASYHVRQKLSVLQNVSGSLWKSGIKRLVLILVACKSGGSAACRVQFGTCNCDQMDAGKERNKPGMYKRQNETFDCLITS